MNRTFNLNSIKQTLNNTSPTVKFITSITIIGYLLSFSPTAINVISVIPGNLLPPNFWIWTAFTFCFLEIHIWEVLVDIICVVLCCKIMEPIWDQMRMLEFFAIVNFGVAVLSSMYYLLLFALTRSTEILFDTKIHGLSGFLAGLSVSTMLVMPDLLIARFPMGKFTNRNIPLTVMISSVILWALNLISGTYPVMFCSGLLTSFIYLRFYQRQMNGVRGTSAENFTFASFFPSIMQPVISMLVNPIYKFSLRIGLVRAPIIQAIPSSSSSELRSVTVSMPNIDQQDMERRRQIALKALNERWKAMNTSDSNKSLPKSFPQAPQTKHQSHSGHSHSHQHGHSHGHSHQHGGYQVIPKFDINELIKPIPLPAPPSMMPTQSPSTAPSNFSDSSTPLKPSLSKSSEKLINLDDTSSSTLSPTSPKSNE